MDQIENVLNVLIYLASDSTDGYGPRPIPDAIDDTVRMLVSHLLGADSATRRSMLSIMDEDHGSVLTAFAERMASLAVRSGNAQFVREGLAATAFAFQLSDWKDVMPVLAPLYRSLQKLNQNPVDFFEGVVGLGDEEFDAVVSHFPNRSEKDRSIEAMDYSEGQDQDGFRYVRTWMGGQCLPDKNTLLHWLAGLIDYPPPREPPRDV